MDKKLYGRKGDYDDYKYDEKCLIFIKNSEWMGFYNIDSIISIHVLKKDKV